MNNKILYLAKLTIWFVLGLFVGSLIFKGCCSLTNKKEPTKEFSTAVVSEKGHDYLLVSTKHGVCVLYANSCSCNNKKIPKQ